VDAADGARHEDRKGKGVMAILAIEDEVGNVGGGAAGTNQISNGAIEWSTCEPYLLWARGTWSPGSLASSVANLHSNEDWLFEGTHTMIWYKDLAIVRHEVRTFSYKNGSATDSTEIDYVSGVLADSAIESQSLATTTYTETYDLSGTYTPPTALVHRPETLTINYRQGFFDQSLVEFDTINILTECSLSSVYRATRDVGGIPIPVKDGRVGSWLWDIWRSANGVQYGRAWEDCTGGGGGESGGVCPCASSRKPISCPGSQRTSVACAGIARRAVPLGNTLSSRKACG
jgi:hypothetical protein